MTPPTLPPLSPASGSTFVDVISSPGASIAVIAAMLILPFILVFLARLYGRLCFDEDRADARRQRQVLLNEETLRTRLRGYLFVQTNFGLYWELFQTCLAFMSCIAYIVSTYYENCVVVNPDLDRWLEISFVAFFLLDYLLNIYLARETLAWFFSPVALADMLTIVPTVMEIIVKAAYEDDDIFACGDTQFFKFVRLIRFLRVVRALRLFRVNRFSASQSNSVSQQLLRIMTTLLTLILIASCLFLYVETYDNPADADRLKFHQALYYMLIEVVGRPRVPITTEVGGFVIASLVVMVVVVVVPMLFLPLFEALRKDSHYRRQSYEPAPGEEHVIIGGHVTFSSVHDFIFDFLHEDHGHRKTKVRPLPVAHTSRSVHRPTYPTALRLVPAPAPPAAAPEPSCPRAQLPQPLPSPTPAPPQPHPTGLRDLVPPTAESIALPPLQMPCL